MKSRPVAERKSPLGFLGMLFSRKIEPSALVAEAPMGYGQCYTPSFYFLPSLGLKSFYLAVRQTMARSPANILAAD
jgi:hypothetical protein